jgi:hypothetical protein
MTDKLKKKTNAGRRPNIRLVTFPMDANVYQASRLRAKAADRSWANWVRYLIRKELNLLSQDEK